MKKVILISLIASVLVSCCGCSKTADASSASTTTDSSIIETSSSETSSEETTSSESVESTSSVVSSAPAVSSTPAVASTPKSTSAPTTQTPSSSSTTAQTQSKKIMPTTISPAGASDMEVKLFNKINEERKKNGVSALRWSSELYASSKKRATEASQVYSHNRPDGASWKTAFEGIVNKYTTAQKQNYTIGENLNNAQDAAEFSADAIVDAIVEGWLSSPSHKANLLKSEWTATAVAVYSPDNGSSYYAEQVFGDFFVS